METGNLCIYNVSCSVLLSEHVTEVNDDLDPALFLTLLLNGPGISRQASIWLRRSAGPRDWPPRLFAFDVACLDADGKIIESGSVGPGTEFPCLLENSSSVLFLPDGRLSETSSTRGNVIRICTKAELAAKNEPAWYPSTAPGEAHMQAQPFQNQPEASPSADVTRLPEFAFEPFVGSLVYLPDAARPRAQSSEYFLTREVVEMPLSVPSQEDEPTEDLQVQSMEESIAEPASSTEPISPELSVANLSKAEEATSPALEEAIQMIREQARRETEVLKENRKKKPKTPSEKRTPANRWPRRVEKRAARSQTTTLHEPIAQYEPLATTEPMQNPELLSQAAPEVLELRSIPEPSAEIPSAIEELEAPNAQPENAAIEAEEVVPLSVEQQIDEDTVSSVFEFAAETAEPQPEELNEPLSEITAPQTTPRWREKKDRISFGRRLQHWLAGAAAAPRRRSTRITVPGLVAFYWSGGAPMPHEIVNISKSGFYLRTRDLWLPDTLVRMTLQRPIPNVRNKNESIGVLARVVRIGDDGVGHEFVTTEDLRQIRTQHVLPDRGTSPRELEKFLSMR